ncbi:MAG: CoA transferase [Oricola sp.]
MGALDGLKIADFSWVGAGPRATKDLADNGATVIKIESRKRLDLGRRSPPFAGDPKDFDGSAFFAQTNTSKKSVTINLGDPRGVEIARKLVAWSDVVVENFGPGYMERIGLGFEDLKAVRSDIILVSVSVAGRTGPMAGFRGYGNSAAAHSGHAAMTGWPGTEPHMPPFAYGDVVAPMFATVGTLAALEHRDRTGEGQHVDVSQIEPMVHVIADLYADADLGEKPGNSDPVMAPHGVYPCEGEENWIAIAVESDGQWTDCCSALGAEALAADRRFATVAGRRENAAELDERISELTASRDKFDLAAALAAAGVPAGPVLDGKEVFENEELRAAHHFVKSVHAVLGESMMPAPPMQLSDTPWRIEPSPLLGEHNREIFVSLLGMEWAEVEKLAEAGVLA